MWARIFLKKLIPAELPRMSNDFFGIEFDILQTPDGRRDGLDGLFAKKHLRPLCNGFGRAAPTKGDDRRPLAMAQPAPSRSLPRPERSMRGIWRNVASRHRTAANPAPWTV